MAKSKRFKSALDQRIAEEQARAKAQPHSGNHNLAAQRSDQAPHPEGLRPKDPNQEQGNHERRGRARTSRKISMAMALPIPTLLCSRPPL